MESKKVLGFQKGFTLIEVLIVLILTSLVFGIVLLVLKVAGISGIRYDKKSDLIRQNLLIYYRLKHQLEGAMEFLQFKTTPNEKILKFYTTQGYTYPGNVEVCYKYINGTLYYAEQIEGLKDEKLCENSTYAIGTFKSFVVKCYYKGKIYNQTFTGGIPEKVEIVLGKIKILATPKWRKRVK